MRKIIAAEFMTIDGVIRREEAHSDEFKYGGWFFPVRIGRSIRALWSSVMTVGEVRRLDYTRLLPRQRRACRVAPQVVRG